MTGGHKKYIIKKTESLAKKNTSPILNDTDNIRASIKIINKMTTNARITNNLYKTLSAEQTKTFNKIQELNTITSKKKQQLENDLQDQELKLRRIMKNNVVKGTTVSEDKKNRKVEWISMSEIKESLKKKGDILKWLENENKIYEEKIKREIEMRNQIIRDSISIEKRSFKSSNIKKEINHSRIYTADNSKNIDSSISIGVKILGKSNSIIEMHRQSSQKPINRTYSSDFLPRLSFNGLLKISKPHERSIKY